MATKKNRRRPTTAEMESSFWKEEFTIVIKKFYPITWKEELWRASLRLIDNKKMVPK